MQRIEILTRHLEPKLIEPSITTNSITTNKRNIMSHRYPNGCFQIILNRHEALNSLNYDMILELTELLLFARQDTSIHFVILCSHHPKAFCAGGDIKQLTGTIDYAQQFFKMEFQLCQLIARFPKPVTSLLNGIVMGGGVGISINSTFRIGNEENYTFAMPETSIGLYPDVGGSYFLSQVCNFELGVYIGLTGERLKCGDALHCNFLTHSVKNFKEMQNLENQLVVLKIDVSDVENHLKMFFSRYENPELAKSSSLSKLEAKIQQNFAKSTIEEIMAALKVTDPKMDQLLTKKCPTSMKLTLDLLQKGKTMSLEQVYQMDFHFAVQMIQRSDLKEGVRAVLVDRDNNPKWIPNSIENVNLEKELDMNPQNKLTFY